MSNKFDGCDFDGCGAVGTGIAVLWALALAGGGWIIHRPALQLLHHTGQFAYIVSLVRLAS